VYLTRAFSSFWIERIRNHNSCSKTSGGADVGGNALQKSPVPERPQDFIRLEKFAKRHPLPFPAFQCDDEPFSNGIEPTSRWRLVRSSVEVLSVSLFHLEQRRELFLSLSSLTLKHIFENAVLWLCLDSTSVDQLIACAGELQNDGQ
jgi:hypothetical protein